jgi:multicomponent Na+:H+ antiporter subunit D
MIDTSLMGWLDPFLGIPPGLLMVAGALLLFFLPTRIRPWAFLFFPLAALGLLLNLPDGIVLQTKYLGFDVVLISADQLSRVFGTIFALIALIGGIFALHVTERKEQAAALAYAGGSLGVVFAGDYLTFYLFWELMAVASTFLIWSRGDAASERAGFRYIVFHIFGGALLLGGIVLRVFETGSTLITTMSPADGLSAWLILAGVAVNAAVFPLHAWLPDAYPRATATGAAFLSAFTTKTAVYALARMYPGWEILVFFGVAMTIFGVTYAFLQNDIRGIFSYHIVSQVGYMVVGIGIGTELALNGAAAHAYSHILYKALLFMSAGAILQAAGTTRLTELGGFLRGMPWLFGLYMVGAFSISGVPFFNGFISKSMVVSAALYDGRYALMWLLQLAAVGTFLSIALKVPFIAWFGSGAKVQPKPIPRNMYVAMGGLAFLCFLYGIAPNLLYVQLPPGKFYEPFTIAHFVESIQMLTFTFVAFYIMRSLAIPKPGMVLDVDWFYRRPALVYRAVFVDFPWWFMQTVEALVLRLVGAVGRLATNPAPALQSFVAGRKMRGGQAFSPDRARPSTQVLVGIVLASCTALALFSLLR